MIGVRMAQTDFFESNEDFVARPRFQAAIAPFLGDIPGRTHGSDACENTGQKSGQKQGGNRNPGDVAVDDKGDARGMMMDRSEELAISAPAKFCRTRGGSWE